MKQAICNVLLQATAVLVLAGCATPPTNSVATSYPAESHDGPPQTGVTSRAPALQSARENVGNGSFAYANPIGAVLAGLEIEFA